MNGMTNFKRSFTLNLPLIFGIFPNMFLTTNARFTQCKLVHSHQKTYPNSYNKFMMNIHVAHFNLVP
jgi:hypothetical protein